MHETTADNPVAAASAVAQVYARSLYELAVDAGGKVVDEVGEELSQVVGLMREQRELELLLTNPAINADRRRQSIASIFQGRVSDLTYRFLQVVNEKRRLAELPGIARAYDQIVKAERGEIDVDVYAASELDDKQVKRIGQRIGELVGRTAIVHPHVNESMIGGLKVRVGDRLIDASVATQLQNLKRRMLARGREIARTNAAQIMEEEGSGPSAVE